MAITIMAFCILHNIGLSHVAEFIELVECAQYMFIQSLGKINISSMYRWQKGLSSLPCLFSLRVFEKSLLGVCLRRPLSMTTLDD